MIRGQGEIAYGKGGVEVLIKDNQLFFWPGITPRHV